ncbi:hypothetical protein [Phormidium sp. CCY1219]|uniref:hypothetical protein n=1 Tax=Phormidium sp. CCY1219 TaxID=2886104 RepID=UPI002D1F5E9A|nr:hypothetical protein [Phormidium sp. CCY1219]MEB3828815.1 hypothetical protein [Phormidium sp. CCY1219]
MSPLKGAFSIFWEAIADRQNYNGLVLTPEGVLSLEKVVVTDMPTANRCATNWGGARLSSPHAMTLLPP